MREEVLWIRAWVVAVDMGYGHQRAADPFRDMAYDGTLTTLFAVALAADRLGRKDVFCVVTDTDVNRIWEAKVPANGRTHYLAPTPLTRQRLMQYGVLPERIHFIGFPLPLENLATAAEDLRRRIPVLDEDERGVFRHGYGRVIDAELGLRPTADKRPPSITLAGAAQAQAELAWDILRGLYGTLREGLMRLNLVAGVTRRGQTVLPLYHRRTGPRGGTRA